MSKNFRRRKSDEKGLFISFEALDGAGKTTHLRLLEKYLSKDYFVKFYREPGGTQLGETLRNILKHSKFQEDISINAELFLFMAQRTQNVEKLILPDLSKNEIVIYDRFSDSTFAYQGYGRGISLEKIKSMNDIATTERYPDITFFINASLDYLISKMEERVSTITFVKDRFESEEVEFHKRIRDGYLDIAKENPERIKTIQYIEGNEGINTMQNEIRGYVDNYIQENGLANKLKRKS